MREMVFSMFCFRYSNKKKNLTVKNEKCFTSHKETLQNKITYQPLYSSVFQRV